jgi:hypothetical protein
MDLLEIDLFSFLSIRDFDEKALVFKNFSQ